MGFNSGFKGLNGFVCFAERRNLVSVRVPSHFKRSLSVHVRGFLCERFVTRYVVSNSPNPQAGGPLLVGCTLQLIQYTRSYFPY